MMTIYQLISIAALACAACRPAAEPAVAPPAAPQSTIPPAIAAEPTPAPPREKVAQTRKHSLKAPKTPVLDSMPERPKPDTLRPVAPSHATFDTLLQQFVSETGRVNYAALKSRRGGLDTYCRLLSENPVQAGWTRAEKMAYWINAYNAFTLKLMIDHYPTQSILNFDGGKTWDVRRIKLGDQKFSLNQIENEILRPEFKDARIHFAINCAARSCPPLWNRAYTADNLEEALETRTRAFINDAKYNTLGEKSARVSKIFEWYSADFGDLKTYINRYAARPLLTGCQISFQEYDWKLNE